MRHPHRRTALKTAAAALLSAALLLTGCASTPSPAAGGSTTPGGQLDNLTVLLGSEISTLSVNQQGGTANYKIAALIQEGLVGIDRTGKLVPALAESWTNTDYSTWVYKIRQGVTFSDGTPLTTDDIIFSIELARDPKKSPGLVSYWPSYLTSVKKTGDWEITVKLDGSHPGFGPELSNAGGLTVTSQAFYNKVKNYGSSTDLILGTGPYKVTEFDPSSHVSLERVDSYWGGASGPKTVRINFVTDDATRQLAFQQGQADVSLTVPLLQADQWTAQGGTVQYYSDRSYQGLTFDPNIAPFNDPHVRKAFAHAIDTSGIVAGILKGHGSAATGIDSPQQLSVLVGLDAAKAGVASLPAADYSLDKAKAELAASSVPGGFSTTLTYPKSDSSMGKASLAIAESLAKIGVTVNVKEISIDQWLSEVGNGKQGVAWMSYIPTTPTPNEISSWLLNAGGAGTNPAGWKDAAVAAKEASVSTIADKQKQFDTILSATSDALNQGIYAPVYWGEAALAVRPGITASEFGSFTLGTNWAAAFTKAS